MLFLINVVVVVVVVVVFVVVLAVVAAVVVLKLTRVQIVTNIESAVAEQASKNWSGRIYTSGNKLTYYTRSQITCQVLATQH